jgi:hypothetical protein
VVVRVWEHELADEEGVRTKLRRALARARGGRIAPARAPASSRPNPRRRAPG